MLNPSVATPTTIDDLRLLAHEIRSPVAALTAIVEVWGDADAQRRTRLLEIAATAIASIDRMLADVQSAAIGSGCVDVAALVRDAVDAAALRGPVVLAPVAGEPAVDGDVQRLHQALDNLIANALRHAPAGTAVTVTVSTDGPDVVVTVADTGEGIAAEDAERVFEPGVSLSGARESQGLGLAVVRAVARAHGGDVELESAPGEGATFRLVLPAASGGR